ncbi:hypothetical protein [Devosia beringensis]|uniref:hypothetical protein n=1 Tax=Devosia beringensis TaxID=2657486 RepID=UPI00186B9DD1|nr:hypothetical protein [Devosia beringensis]
MSRRPAMVTQADVARALRAVDQVGIAAVVEIARDGTIRIVPADLARASKLAPLDDDDDFQL